MKIQFLMIALILVALVIFPHIAYADQQNTQCDAIELVQGSQEYNELVCQSIHAMNIQDYKSAIEILKRAIAVHLFEIPNYKLYPRLALAYFENGNRKEAEENLEMSRLSLSVAVGIMHCEETKSGFYIAQFATERVNSSYNQEAARLMCGDAYEEAYASRTLKGVVADAKLIEYYFSVRAQIQTTR